MVIGTNTWEFVQGDPIPNSGGLGVVPVPVNQLYVHHLSGRVVLGQGSEGIRRSDVQVPFPDGYGTLSGDEGDASEYYSSSKYAYLICSVICLSNRCYSPKYPINSDLSYY